MLSRRILFVLGNLSDTCTDRTRVVKNSGCVVSNMETKLSPRLENGKWKSVHGCRLTSVRDLMRILYEAYVEEYGEPESEQPHSGSTPDNES
jgi:hypothetical protein